MSVEKLVDAEKSVIASMIISKEAVEKIIDNLDSNLFKEPVHKLLINTIKNLYQKQIPVDMVTIHDTLKDDTIYQDNNGSVYISELTDYIPTAENIQYYYSILQDHAKKENIVKVGQELIRLTKEKTSTQDLLTYFNEQNDLLQSDNAKIRIEEELTEFLELNTLEIQNLYSEQLNKSQIKTGFKLIDYDFSLSPTDFNVITSRSNHGKTSFMIHLLTNFLENETNTSCHFITYETTKLRLITKILNNLAKKKNQLLFHQKVNGEDTFSGQTTTTEFFDQWIKDKRLSVMQNIAYEDIKSFVRLIKKQCKDKTIVLFLDYVQIIPNRSKKEGWEKIKDLSYGLERLAVDEEIILFTGSQVNDKDEVREGKDIYNSATNVFRIFNHSHDGLLKGDKAKDYRPKEDNLSTISIFLDKAKYFQTRSFGELFYFDGNAFTEKNYVQNLSSQTTPEIKKAKEYVLQELIKLEQ